jgi:hypothetical protein
MADHNPTLNPTRERSNDVHPFIYRAIAGLVLVFMAAAWGFFGDQGRTPFLLSDVTYFGVIAIALPYILLQMWRRNHVRPHRLSGSDFRFKDWSKREIDTWGDHHLKASEATVLILSPFAAVAGGLVILFIALRMAT